MSVEDQRRGSLRVNAATMMTQMFERDGNAEVHPEHRPLSLGDTHKLRLNNLAEIKRMLDKSVGKGAAVPISTDVEERCETLWAELNRAHVFGPLPECVQ
jgi:hypothetical protein